MATTLVAAALGLLGFQAIRTFLTQNFWVQGEVSNRLVLAAVVFAVFLAWGLAGPLSATLGLRRARLLALVLLAVAALVGQAVPHPVVDLFIGAAGTAAFGWVLALSLAGLGRAAGHGLALAFAGDVAIRSVLLTVDAPLSDSPLAAAIVAALAAVALAGALPLSARPAEFAGLRKSLPLLGVGPALMVYLVFSGNFGQAAARDAIDLRAALLWVGAGAAGGALWSARFTSASRAAGSLHVLAAAVVIIVGAGLSDVNGVAAVVSAALLGLGLPVALGALFDVDRSGASPAWSVSLLTISGVLLVALLFVFYSFYGPWLMLPAAALLVVVPALVPTLASELVRPVRTPDDGSKALLLLASALFVPSLVMGVLSGPAPTQAPDAPELRVTTYNIRQGFGTTSRFDLEAVARELERQPADIIALQEVGRGWVISGGVDTLAWLSQRLGMPAYFGAYVGDLWGTAILTRLPVIESSSTLFDLSGRIPRGFQRVVVRAAGGPVTVINTHLDHEETDEGASARSAQTVQLLEALGRAHPIVLVGDLNAEPDAPSIHTLGNAGFVDAHPGGPPTYRADDPTQRIDYIFVTPDLRVTAADVGMSMASDHLPVRATAAPA